MAHGWLLKNAEALGIDGDTLRWIRDIVVGRHQSVSVNGSLSDWAAVKSGVPQDSVLGAALFVAFINDLPGPVSNMCAMYADDMKVHGPVNNSEDGDKLQKGLDALVDWEDIWQLRFNADKCKVLHMGKNNEQHCYKMRKHGGQ